MVCRKSGIDSLHETRERVARRSTGMHTGLIALLEAAPGLGGEEGHGGASLLPQVT